MACDVNQQLVNEAGRIGPDIYRKSLYTTIWSTFIDQGVFPDGMGQTIQVLTYARTLPANNLTWTEVDFNDGSDSTCSPDALVVPEAQILRSYAPFQVALESEKFCVKDIYMSFQRQKQLAAVYDNLVKNGKYAWENRYRDQYIEITGTKVIAASGLPEGTTTFPVIEATSRLTQGILNKYYMQLVREGAGMGALGVENGRAVFGLITSSETSLDIITQNEQIRQDYRFSSKVNELLAPLGIERSYQGFYHIIDDFCPRWNWVNGAYERVYPYTSAAATYGTQQIVNPDYSDAEFEDTLIFHREVYRSLVPSVSVTSPGGNTRFDPLQYRGEFEWLNIRDNVCNKDGNTGYFRAVFMNGSEPIHPEYGVAIRHRRCPNNDQLLACS